MNLEEERKKIATKLRITPEQVTALEQYKIHLLSGLIDEEMAIELIKNELGMKVDGSEQRCANCRAILPNSGNIFCNYICAIEYMNERFPELLVLPRVTNPIN